LTYFRKRIGEQGVEKIFQASVQIHGESAYEFGAEAAIAMAKTSAIIAGVKSLPKMNFSGSTN
jgi:hypothetical protein